MNRYNIRKASKSDLNELLDLWKGMMDFHRDVDSKAFKLKKNSRSIMRSFFIKNLKSKNSLVLVAEDGGKPIGYLMGFVKDKPLIYVENKMGFISDGCVAEAYRKKGIMKKMIQKANVFFKQKKMGHVYLTANSVNHNAVKSWSKIGFKEQAKEMYMKIK